MTYVEIKPPGELMTPGAIRHVPSAREADRAHHLAMRKHRKRQRRRKLAGRPLG